MGNCLHLLHCLVSLKSFSILFSITFSLLLCVSKVASSAKKSEKQCFKNRGNSFMKRRNKVGSNIDPWVTPEFTLANSERPAPHAISQNTVPWFVTGTMGLRYTGSKWASV